MSSKGHGARRWAVSSLGALGVSLAVFVFYFSSYPIRHLPLPVGFDPPFWVWRAQYVASQGLGRGTLAARPGYPVLSALLGAVTGRPQLEMAVVLPLVLVAVLALAMGALVREALPGQRRAWVTGTVVAALVAGSTQLVGENLSNLLNLALTAAALVMLANRSLGRRGVAGAAALLVASGLAHWDFLALTVAVLAGAILLALRASPGEERAAAGGEIRAVAIAAGVAVVVTGVVVFGLLHSSLRTGEVVQDPVLYRRFLATDVVRLLWPWMAAVACVPLLRALFPSRDRARVLLERVLVSWAVVTAIGVVGGEVTAKLPPSRFLALLAVVPGAVGVSAFVTWGVRRGKGTVSWRRRFEERLVIRQLSSAAFIVPALFFLAWPASLRWFRYPVLMRPETLQEAQAAAAYVRTLPHGSPVVFVLGYEGAKPGAYQTVVKERAIRIAMPAGRQPDLYFFVGKPSDFVAGRRTPPPDARTGRITLPYWQEVRSVLGRHPPAVVLQDTGRSEFRAARGMGARVIGLGVAVLQGPPPRPVALPPPASVVPSWAGGLVLALALLATLALVGGGWTAALARAGGVEAFACLSPTIGAGALVLGGFVAAMAGVHLDGGMGAVILVLTAGLGYFVATLSPRPGGSRRRAAGPGESGTSGRMRRPPTS